MKLTYGQMIVLGIAILFGIPILAAIILGHIFGFWTGAFVGGGIFVIILVIQRRWAKRQGNKK